MKRVIPLLLLLAIGGVVVYLHPQWYRRATVENVLRLSGNIEAHESLVSFKVTGRVVDLPIEEGMTLKAGDLLARLDNDDYRQQLAVARSTVPSIVTGLNLPIFDHYEISHTFGRLEARVFTDIMRFPLEHSHSRPRVALAFLPRLRHDPRSGPYQ